MTRKHVQVVAILMAVLFSSFACLPGISPLPTATKTILHVPTATFLPTDTPTERPPSPPTEPGPALPAATGHFTTGELVILRSIKMIDVQNGWGLNGPYVLHTTDGGATWQERTPPQVLSEPARAAAYASFLDANSAWVIISEREQIPPAASLWVTTDGGLTWRTSAPILHEAFGDLVWGEFAAYGTGTGWLMMRGVYVGAGTHYNMQMLHSTDAGLTWSPLPGADVGVDYTGLAFTDPSNGWMIWQTTGAYYGGPPEYAVTTDGGSSWLPRSLPPPADDPGIFDTYPYCEPSRLNLLSDSTVRMLVGCYEYGNPPTSFLGNLYASEDGGTTWQIRPLPATVFPESYDLLFFGPDTALLLGRVSYRTTDGGATWEPLSTVYWDGQYSFVDPSHGWATVHMGEDTALVRTLDGGTNWEMIPAVIGP